MLRHRDPVSGGSGHWITGWGRSHGCVVWGREFTLLQGTPGYDKVMTRLFSCPYLGARVELSGEREAHIIASHPGILPDYLVQLANTLEQPDQVRSSDRDPTALLFSKWFDSIRTGRYLVVVTISDVSASRHWVITAYTARKLTGGTPLWQKS